MFLYKGYQASYCKKLIEWIKMCGFSSVIMLSSVNAIDRVDAQIKGLVTHHISKFLFLSFYPEPMNPWLINCKFHFYRPSLRYLTTTTSLKDNFDKLSWIAFEKKSPGIFDDKGNLRVAFAFWNCLVLNHLFLYPDEGGLSLKDQLRKLFYIDDRNLS